MGKSVHSLRGMLACGLAVAVLSSPLSVPANAAGLEQPEAGGGDSVSVPHQAGEVEHVDAVVKDEVAPARHGSADEDDSRWRSRFPEHPELYVPIPLPEATEPGTAAEGESRSISFNMVTGEETTSDISGSDFPPAAQADGGFPARAGYLPPEAAEEQGAGQDSFTALSLISNPEDYPWCVNVKLFITMPGPTYWVGSGTLIDPMHVLTAGHCVHEGPGGDWATDIVVVPAYEDGVEPYGYALEAGLHTWTGWATSGDFDYDMGVIDLDRPIGCLTGWHAYGYDSDCSFYTNPANTFHNPGYPATSPYDGEYMYYWYGAFDECADYQLTFHNQSYGGQSGSGAYYIDGSDRVVHAELSNGNDTLTRDVRITSTKFGHIQDFIAYDTPSTFDLMPLDVDSAPATVSPGNQLSSMDYVVHNYSSASWSGTVDVTVYLSTNNDMSTLDTPIQSHSFTHSFGPKSSVVVNVSPPPTIPADTPAGDYYLGVILDIADDDTANNDSDGQDASPVQVTAAQPDITVTPTSFDVILPPGVTQDYALNVGNAGAVTLTYAISDGGTPWLSEAPASGSVAYGENDAIAVTVDTSGMTVGSYDADITVSSNDPDEPSLQIPVALDVAEPIIRIEPETLNFQEVDVGGGPSSEAEGAGAGAHPLPENWVGFDNQTEGLEAREPHVDVLSSTPDSLDIQLHVPGFSYQEIMNDAVAYRALYLGGYSGELPPGEPDLPGVRKYIAVPSGMQADVRVDMGEAVVLPGYRVSPVQPPQTDDSGSGQEFVVNDDSYGKDEWLPSRNVYLGPAETVRGKQIRLLHVCPFEYNPAQDTLRVYPDIDIDVDFAGTRTAVDARLRSETFDALILGSTANGSVVVTEDWVPEASHSGETLLIITAPVFEAQANLLANHKTNNEGIDTVVVTTDVAGSTDSAIQNYIQTAYDTWSPAPTYVLLLGDAEHIPTNYETTHPSSEDCGLIGTDLYYSTLDGSDILPDVFLGRIPVDTIAEALTVVQKIIDYESDPPQSSTFYSHAVVAAYFQDGTPYPGTPDGIEDRAFVWTSEEVRDFLESEGYDVQRVYAADTSATPVSYGTGFGAEGGPLPPELLRANGFTWSGNAADVTSAINGGSFLVLHRDHGADRNFVHCTESWSYSYTGWGDPCYDETHVASLSNGDLLPVVLSMNCMTGWFDGETDDNPTRDYESFCELLLRKENGGAVGVIGATRTSWSGYNDVMTMGIIDSIWPDFLDAVPNSGPGARLGPMLNHGKLVMDELWYDAGITRQAEYEMFHVFGDPSLELWTSNPADGFVIHNDGPVELEVTSMSTRDGDPWLSFTPHAPFTVPAGGSRPVAVSIDWGQAEWGMNEDRIVVESNDTDMTPYPSPAVTINASSAACVAPTVTTGAATNVEETTATGHGDITSIGGANCDERGVCWSTSHDPDIDDDTDSETGGSFGTGAFTASMTGLSAEETYYVRAYAHNSGGYGYGEEVSFTTTSLVDWGDAPDSTYPTLLASNGARHVINSSLYLGSAIDGEDDGQPDANATGDDLAGVDDEDGVVFNLAYEAGQEMRLTVTASQAGCLDAWVDFNNDGDWADDGEQVFGSTSPTLIAGSNTLTFQVPEGADTENSTFARFRFSSIESLSYTGVAPDGEVEDYKRSVPGVSIQLSLLTGWNMVSVPVQAEHMATSEIFPDATVYEWDPETKSYIEPSTIDPRKGYWVAVSGPRDVTVSGLPVETWEDDLVAGWHMIGSVFGDAVDVNNLDDGSTGAILKNSIYYWNPSSNSYETSYEIVGGQGYWVAATQGCTLTVAPLPPS